MPPALFLPASPGNAGSELLIQRRALAPFEVPQEQLAQGQIVRRLRPCPTLLERFEQGGQPFHGLYQIP